MPKRHTLTYSDALFEAADILRERRRYRNLTEYIVAMTRYDAQTQKDHVFTEEWAALSGDERDRLDKGLLDLVKSGKGVRGSWLLANLSTIIELVWNCQEKPTPEAIAKLMAKKQKPKDDEK